jgi:glucose-6-phosphate isomerase
MSPSTLSPKKRAPVKNKKSSSQASLLWKRYQDYLCQIPSVGFSVDVSRMKFTDAFLKKMEPKLKLAYRSMQELEKGAIANPDEKRMVGHYWLRDVKLAPSSDVRKEIEETNAKIKDFARKIHAGQIAPERGGKFTDLLVIGIGGSALGPQFVGHALGQPGKDKMRIWFFDNTDPDGMDLVLNQIRTVSPSGITSTLTVVISKSGGTKETRNGQLEAKAAYEKAGVSFAKHFVAVTGAGSELSQTVTKEKWITEFPMWDWVGGRTSELSAVGLLPAALQGLDIDEMLHGARLMDQATRSTNTRQNPSALLALMWHYATGGRGKKDMVILPYKDRLLLFSRYLQQLVMESLGKELDLKGKKVNQGIAVYGNKGSTDQHAYVQQLRDGVLNFFITFIEVLKDRQDATFFVEPNTTSGDYLEGFLQGSRQALYESGRESITITIPDVSPKTVGALIALYERTVGFYGSLVNVNAYHQPGVEAGKKAAAGVLQIQKQVIEYLSSKKNQTYTSEELAKELKAEDQVEMIFQILRHLAANPSRKIRATGSTPAETRFTLIN